MSERVFISTAATNNIQTPWFIHPISKERHWEGQGGTQRRDFFPGNVFAQFILSDEDNTNSAFGSLSFSDFSSVSPQTWNASEVMKTDLERFKLSFAQKELEKKLFPLFENEPIEDGYSHPAEKLIEDVCKKYKTVAGTLLLGIYLKNIERPAFITCLLRCIGRLKSDKVVPWGLVMVISSLSHSEVEVRDAAIRALETWGGHESLGVLKVYAEIETVSWLKEYIEQVIRDLSD